MVSQTQESERVERLRVGYLIGALGTGGSERQLSGLAVGMAARGHEVQVACYDGAGAFDRIVEAGRVTLLRMAGGGKLQKLRSIRAWMKVFKPNILHGFMKRASSLAVLANLPERRCKVVASDYSTATYARHKWDLWASLVLWVFADQVATQTEMNCRSLRLLAPWLRRKVLVVRNGVATDRFSPIDRPKVGREFRFLVVGTVYKVKNPARLVEAVRILMKSTSRPFQVRWVGPHGQAGQESEDFRAAAALVSRYGLSEAMSFAGPIERIEEAYHWADCLVHVSLQEGMPNAVVEGMACGLPLVVSRVSDLPLIVREARNGFVCDEQRADRIADAMGRILALEDQERLAMGARSRELAVRWFGRERFVTDYENLYRGLLEDRRSGGPGVF